MNQPIPVAAPDETVLGEERLLERAERAWHSEVRATRRGSRAGHRRRVSRGRSQRKTSPTTTSMTTPVRDTVESTPTTSAPVASHQRAPRGSDDVDRKRDEHHERRPERDRVLRGSVRANRAAASDRSSEARIGSEERKDLVELRERREPARASMTASTRNDRAAGHEGLDEHVQRAASIERR